jgi:hypothetical protein
MAADSSDPSRRFDGVVAVAIDDEGKMADAILGHAVSFEIADDFRVTPDELTRIFEIYGIPRTFFPKTISPGDEFRSLFSSFRRRPEFGGRDYELEFIVKEKSDGSRAARLVRTILTEDEEGPKRRGSSVRTMRDDRWERITVGAIVWHPDFPDVISNPEIDDRYGRIEEFTTEDRVEDPERLAAGEFYEPTLVRTLMAGARPLTFDERIFYEKELPFYEDLFSAVEDEFHDRRMFYGGKAVRKIVTDVLNSTMAISVRPAGGLWLVDKDSTDLLDRTEQMINLLASGEYRRNEGKDDKPSNHRTFVISLPLMAVEEKYRIFVRGAVETRMLDELDTAISQMVALADAKTEIRPAEVMRIMTLRQDALAFRERFAEVMAGPIETVDERLELLDSAFARVRNRATARAD